AAIPAIKAGGKGGHIVLISSVTYNMTTPYAAYYAASKAFVSSIGNALRLELEADNIGVTTMVVGRTNTKFNESRLGGERQTGGGVPTMKPEEVAEGILRGVDGNKPQVYLRPFDRLLVWANILVPNFVGRRALKQYK
ncbi:MAG: SDR family NAD(P)-dependent oxidoreductase, partial [Chloroflexota bacterium]